MIYTVTTKVTSADNTTRSFETLRRYNDFVWLHTQLASTFPGVIIPPLPDKSIVGRFSAEFIDARRRGLQKFLYRVMTHRLLCKSLDLPPFIMTEEANFEKLKRDMVVSQSKQAAPQGILEYFSDIQSSFQSTFGKQVEVPPTRDDVMCADFLAYAQSLETSLGAVDANTETMLRRSKDLGQAYYEFGLCFTHLGQYETEQQNASLGQAFGKLGHCADHLSNLFKMKSGREAVAFSEPVKDYLRLLEGVKNMMKTRKDAADKLVKNIRRKARPTYSP